MMVLELVKLCIWSLWHKGRLLPLPALGEHSLDPGEQRAAMRTGHIYRARAGGGERCYMGGSKVAEGNFRCTVYLYISCECCERKFQ